MITIPPPELTNNAHPNHALNNDTTLKNTIQTLIQTYNIRTIIETGTFLGETTAYLSTLTPSVHTIEINPFYHSLARTNITKWINDNTITPTTPPTLHYGPSSTILPDLIPTLQPPILYYLDAHWEPEHPLLNELETIGRTDNNPIIIIHDFQVPNTNLKYDFTTSTFNIHGDSGQPLNLQYIQPYLPPIYKTGYNYTYNNQDTALGDKIGVIIITPIIT